MPKITVDVPVKFMPSLVTVGTKYLTNLGVDITGFTNVQIVQTYLLKSLRHTVVEQKRANVEATNSAAIMAAIEAAKTATATTITQVEIEVEEIV